MKRIGYIFGAIFLILFLLASFFIYRYNLFYGETTFQKSVMLGCVQQTNKKINNADAKKICECYADYLFDNYTEKEIEDNIDEIVQKNFEKLQECNSAHQQTTIIKN